jgi:hypothetical protein
MMSRLTPLIGSSRIQAVLGPNGRSSAWAGRRRERQEMKAAIIKKHAYVTIL